MKKAIFTILVFVLVLSGCSLSRNDDNKIFDQKAGLANPASTFCVEQGGKLEMRNNDAGQYGVCKFDDGSECEEWAFFRLECKPGQVTGSTEQVTDNTKQIAKDDKKENVETQDFASEEVKGVVKTGNDKIKVFDIESGDNIISPVTIKGETDLDIDSLVVELLNNNREALVKEKVNVKKGDNMNTFEIKLNFEFTNTKEGYITVYEEDDSGEEMNLVEIPVKFNEGESE